MTEKTQIKFSDLDIKEPTKIDVRGKIYEHVPKKFDGGNISVNPQYDIHEAKFGIGNPSVFLFGNPHKEIRRGDIQLYLTPKKDLAELITGEPPYKITKSMCNKAMVELAKDEKPLKKLVEKHQEEPIFFELSTGVSNEELLKLTSNQLQEAITGFLTNGLNIDRRILFVFKLGLLQVDPQVLDPQDYMRYNSHSMIFTNPKTLKSTMGERIGQRYDTASVPGLMGFSTAERSITGSWHNMVESAYLDEVQQETKEDIFGKLLNFMELGKCKRSVGMAERVCTGYPSINFIGNTKEEEGTEDLFLSQRMMDAFLDVLQKITDNSRAFSSRIAVTLFNQKLKEVEAVGELNRDLFLIYQAVVKTLFEQVCSEFSELYFNKTITNWLNKRYNNEYTEQIKALTKEAGQSMLIAYLWGHLEAYKHSRGFALKLAVLDHIYEFLHHNVNVEQLLKTADSRFEELKELNLQSFSVMTKAVDKEFLRKAYVKSFEQEPDHIKALLYALSQMDVEELGIITQPEIEPHLFANNPHRPMNLSVPRIWERLYKDQTKTSARLERYGLELTHIEKTLMAVRIHRLDILKELTEVKENAD